MSSSALAGVGGGHPCGCESTRHSSDPEQRPHRLSTPCTCLITLRLHFFPLPRPAPLRSGPEPGFLWTHRHAHRSAPDPSSQLWTCCETTVTSTCHQAGQVTWLCSQPAQLGKNESAGSHVRDLEWSVTQGPQEINDLRMIPAGNSLKPPSLREGKILKVFLLTPSSRAAGAQTLGPQCIVQP